MIFASVLVLKIRPSGAKVFVFVEIFQFILRKLVNDTPDFFRDAIAGQASTRICGRRGDRRYNKALA